MSFATQNINANGYQIQKLAKGTAFDDAIRLDQLTPVIQDVQNLTEGMANYVRGDQFLNRFNLAAQEADLWNGTQVNQAIGLAIAGIPDVAERLGGVAVKDVVVGTYAEAIALVPSLGLTPMDSGEIDDAAQSCVLVVSSNIAEAGLYQLQTNGTLVKLNQALVNSGLGFYTEFIVVASNNRRARQFAVTDLDLVNAQFMPVEAPYTDEYAGLGPITVSQINKTINFRFSAADFVVDTQGEFQLHPALKSVLEEVPTLRSDLTALEDVVNDLNAALTQRIDDLADDVSALTQTVQGHTQNISDIQITQGDLLARIAQLEINALRKSDFAKSQEVWFQGLGSGPFEAFIKDESGTWVLAPVAMVEALNETSSHVEVRVRHDRGYPVLPIYAYTDINGVTLNSTMLHGAESMSDQTTSVLIEKGKRVKLIFSASVKAASIA